MEVEWRGFELHPETPPGGMPLERLFPGRSQAMRAHVEQFARGFGVTGMKVPGHLYSTRRALAVAEWARDQGRLEPFRTAVMEAHWRRGEDIEDADVLTHLAEEVGLPGQGARQALASPEYLARVDALRAEAHAAGVSGIPTFFIGEARVVGCQPYEVLAQAARHAGARPRR